MMGTLPGHSESHWPALQQRFPARYVQYILTTQNVVSADDVFDRQTPEEPFQSESFL